jgi:hypothetical protein
MAGYAPLPLKLAVSLAQAVAAVAMRQQNPTSASVAGEEGRRERGETLAAGGKGSCTIEIFSFSFFLFSDDFSSLF